MSSFSSLSGRSYNILNRNIVNAHRLPFPKEKNKIFGSFTINTCEPITPVLDIKIPYRRYLIVILFSPQFKSNVRETWRVILVSEADIFLSESLRILAERLSQSEIGLPLKQICYYSPPEEVGVFSTEINSLSPLQT